MPEVAGRGIRAKWKTQGDLRRSPRRVESWAAWDPDRDSPWPSWRGGLCQRLGPSLYGGSHRTEQEDFPLKKKTQEDTLGNSSAATAPVPSPSGHLPVQGLCASTRECPHLISEGTETTGTRESENQGRLCAHIHSPEETYHKKEWVEARNTRVPPGRGNQQTKETPTDKNRRK